MKITIETVDRMRYATIGDWQFAPNGDLTIRVKRLGDERYEQLVAVHELIEALLCRVNRVDELEVDDFDMQFDGEGEPGDDPDCPYQTEHFAATTVERILSAEMGVAWSEYAAALYGSSCPV